jgi:hypothetical protein
MKEKNGGEDFYFLQGLRKLGDIEHIFETTVYPANRLSSRVAFGTGPRLNKIVSGEVVLAHTPNVFIALKEVVDAIKNGTIEQYNCFESYLNESCSPAVFMFFKENNFFVNWAKIINNTPQKIKYLEAAFYTWFDGFRMLTFVHYLENSYPELYPQQSLESAIETVWCDYLNLNSLTIGTSRKEARYARITLLEFIRENEKQILSSDTK